MKKALIVGTILTGFATVAAAQVPQAVPVIYALRSAAPTHVYVRCITDENRAAECAPAAGEFTSWAVRRCGADGCVSVNAFVYPLVNAKGELQRHIRFASTIPGTYYASWKRGNVSDPAVTMTITTVVQVGAFELNETPVD